MTTRGRQYPDGPLEPPPGAKFVRLPDSAGEFLIGLFAADPSYTLTTGEIRPPSARVEVTAEFCQCPACCAMRLEPVPPESSDEG